MSSNYGVGRLLSGVIYLHCIIDVRMDSSSLRDLGIFHKLCGSGTLRNVLLVTTQWSDVHPAAAECREETLRHGNFWGGLISEGASLERFMGTRESGLELIHKLIGKDTKFPDNQNRLGQKDVTPIKTKLGKLISGELIARQKEFEEVSKRRERECHISATAHPKSHMGQRSMTLVGTNAGRSPSGESIILQNQFNEARQRKVEGNARKL